MMVLASCQKEEKAAAQPIRPVRTVAVELREGGEKVSLTGEIQPRYQADLGFRVNGKILERPVDVGTEVKKDDLLARLDPQQYRQDLEVAKADVAKAQAEVARSQAQEYRQRELLKNGHTTQVAYDQAVKTFKTAQAEADAARARQIQASENLGYTELRADNNGVISAIGADPGQVVSADKWSFAWRSPASAVAVFNIAEGATPHRPWSALPGCAGREPPRETVRSRSRYPIAVFRLQLAPSAGYKAISATAISATALSVPLRTCGASTASAATEPSPISRAAAASLVKARTERSPHLLQ
jgi:multidrug efflux pump subunit AcrA (membrane-fusion protein)